jgi:hypothetical protein
VIHGLTQSSTHLSLGGGERLGCKKVWDGPCCHGHLWEFQSYDVCAFYFPREDVSLYIVTGLLWVLRCPGCTWQDQLPL